MTVMDCVKLAGKTALVTGAKRGIGRSIAEALALAQAAAIISGVSVSLGPAGSEFGTAVEVLGPKFTGYAREFSDRAAVKAFIAQVFAEKPQIHILIINACIILRTPAADHLDEMWDEVIEVNLNAQFIITRDIGKTMVERRSGMIIVIASLLTFQGGIIVPGYAASKGGIGQTHDGLRERILASEATS